MPVRLPRRRQNSQSPEEHSPAHEPVDEDEPYRRSRWTILHSFYTKHLSVELDNTKGSVARDHLANVGLTLPFGAYMTFH